MAQILIFGDSIAYGAWDIEGGWAQRLRKYLDQKIINSGFELYYLVYNLGIDGETAGGILERFENEAKLRIWENEETIIIFSTGANDSIYNKTEKSFRCPPKKYKENLKQLFSLAKKYSDKIIFVGSTPVDRRVDPIPWVPDCSYKNEYIKKYDEIAKAIFENNGGYFIEIFSEFEKLDYEKMLTDGVHPDSKGHEIIFKYVKNYLINNKII
ncbi:MAG: SGNH/GDSL hydrolase family protein [bacterium]|nr:SGNH/GDSL hydrolase family protein [bacterium]